jgi:hypothetical protein
MIHLRVKSNSSHYFTTMSNNSRGGKRRSNNSRFQKVTIIGPDVPE